MELAESLIKSLKCLGVNRIFGIPGGPSIPYMQAMASNGIEFVLVSNEQSAAIMADVTGRLTGTPGVCHATFGPGATNLSTGVGGALLDRSPLIALTTEVKSEDIGRHVQMNIDHQELFGPLTKWTTRLSPDNLSEVIATAFETATSEISGPVHIGLPSDIAHTQVAADTVVTSYDRATQPPPARNILDTAANMVKSAKKPILSVGLTALRLGLSESIRVFVDKNNMPVVSTPMAKGVVPENHPLYAGVLFHSCSDIVANIYRQADLVIAIGYDPIEFNFEAWMPKVPLIHIDSKAADILQDYEAVVDIVGDLAVSVAYLNSLQLPVFDWNVEELSENRGKLSNALQSNSSAFAPTNLLHTLREVLPEDSIVVSDVGAHLHLMGQLWAVKEPNRFLITNGWSAMGFGIPAAIAAKLCNPDKPVVCITGDGGFLMNCGELMTARRTGINIVVIVFCDRDLSLISVKQGWKNIKPQGTYLHEGDYFGAEQFLGAPVFKARNERELKAAIQKAFAVSGPAIIEAPIDGSVYNELIVREYK